MTDIHLYSEKEAVRLVMNELNSGKSITSTVIELIQAVYMSYWKKILTNATTKTIRETATNRLQYLQRFKFKFAEDYPWYERQNFSSATFNEKFAEICNILDVLESGLVENIDYDSL